MKQRIKKVAEATKRFGKGLWNLVFGVNKYIITGVAFLIAVGFVDEYSLLTRYKNIARITELEREYAYYEKQIEGTRKRLDELESDGYNLEKYAREQYFMKRKNEDVFIVK